MKSIFKQSALACRSHALAFICAALSVTLGVALSACSPNQAPIEVRNAWSPAAPPGSSVAAVYLEIVADRPDVLTSVSTLVADSIGLHATLERDGMMEMRPLGELQINPGQPVRFEPGGMHVMLSGVQQALPASSQFPITLHFAEAGDMEVSVTVLAPGATP